MSSEDDKNVPLPGSFKRKTGIARPHRCNPHVDEMILALFEWPPPLAEPFRAFVQCMREGPEKKRDAKLQETPDSSE